MENKNSVKASSSIFPVNHAKDLLDWYDQKSRVMPWRTTPPNPYYVLVSEFMLQQTTVATVTPFFLRFISRFPTLKDLAEACLEEVKTLWQGLGYYRRCVHLHQAAQKIMEEHSGVLSNELMSLRKLPGVGDYTAAALASIVYDVPALAVDGNIARVLSRFLGINLPFEQLKTELKKLSIPLRPGDFNQSMMDLGATICKPKQPLCNLCPWEKSCYARLNEMCDVLPVLKEKPLRPKKFGVAFSFIKGQKEIFLEKRPTKGLLGGMVGVLTTPWRENKPWTLEEAEVFLKDNGIKSTQVLKTQKTITHTFTHFHLSLDVCSIKWEPFDNPYDHGFWADFKDLSNYPIPTLMKKVLG